VLISITLASAFEVPRSNRIVEGRIGLKSGGEEIEYGVREGLMITIEEPGRTKYGLVPIIGEGLKSAKFTPFKLVADGNGGEKIDQISGSKEVDIGEQSQIIIEDIKIGVRQVREEKFSTQPRLLGSPDELRKIYGTEKCCVMCGNVRLCANSIGMDCGKCSRY
jgi:hypothetical protein